MSQRGQTITIGALLAVIAILTPVVAVFWWGAKLESRVDALEREVRSIERRMATQTTSVLELERALWRLQIPPSPERSAHP